jgi:hypothetical protein
MDIVIQYPQVNANWLLKGEGSMFGKNNKNIDQLTSLEAPEKVKWLEAQLN